ncbi:MAG: SAM hydrolase/SAM-dependent halogenase family protein [Thermoleophilia bacterium]
MAEYKFITFLSDFGCTDDFVGTCHGVMKKIAPAVQIIDVTHDVKRHHILQGAVILANTLPYMPESVILAVVDPGVGGQRRPVAIRTVDDRYLVGPDNGLLSLAVARLGGAKQAVDLSCSDFSLSRVCKTFEGRDLFSPVAAHLCKGVTMHQLGTQVPVDELTQVRLPQPVSSGSGLTATVIYVDRFGNIQLNLTAAELVAVGAKLGEKLSVGHGDEEWRVPFVQTYGDVAPEELLVYEDSYGRIAYSINWGDAAGVFQISEGDELRFEAL